MSLGELNHNPFDLKDFGIQWNGLKGKDDKGFCVFVDDDRGLRAGFRDLHTKWARGLTTPEKLIAVFAPPNENDTETYIKNFCADVGVPRDGTLDLSSPANLKVAGRAIIRQENGRCVYPDVALVAAVNEALGLGAQQDAPPAAQPKEQPQMDTPTVNTSHVVAAGLGSLGLTGALADLYAYLLSGWPLPVPTDGQVHSFAVLTIAALGGGGLAWFRPKKSNP